MTVSSVIMIGLVKLPMHGMQQSDALMVRPAVGRDGRRHLLFGLLGVLPTFSLAVCFFFSSCFAWVESCCAFFL